MKHLIYLLIVIIAAVSVFGDINGNEVMERTVPAEVEAGTVFNVVYTVTGGTPPWGASIVDLFTGECTFPAGAELRTVALSEDGNVKMIPVTAGTAGTCTLSGDYKFGDLPIVNFPDVIISVVGEGGIPPAAPGGGGGGGGPVLIDCWIAHSADDFFPCTGPFRETTCEGVFSSEELCLASLGIEPTQPTPETETDPTILIIVGAAIAAFIFRKQLGF